MITLTLKVSDVLNAQLKTFAQKKGLSKSEIVRIALNDYFSKNENDISNSFYDYSKDLSGKIVAEPDLSTSKKYFADYGK